MNSAWHINATHPSHYRYLGAVQIETATVLSDEDVFHECPILILFFLILLRVPFYYNIGKYNKTTFRGCISFKGIIFNNTAMTISNKAIDAEKTQSNLEDEIL